MTSAKAVAERMFTLGRWHHLLQKAWDEGVWLAPHPTNPHLGVCPSQTELRNGKLVMYTVSVYGCSCPARGDCKHRALFLFENPALIPLAILPPDDLGKSDGERQPDRAEVVEVVPCRGRVRPRDARGRFMKCPRREDLLAGSVR